MQVAEESFSKLIKLDEVGSFKLTVPDELAKELGRIIRVNWRWDTSTLTLEPAVDPYQ